MMEMFTATQVKSAESRASLATGLGSLEVKAPNLS